MEPEIEKENSRIRFSIITFNILNTNFLTRNYQKKRIEIIKQIVLLK